VILKAFIMGGEDGSLLRQREETGRIEAQIKIELQLRKTGLSYGGENSEWWCIEERGERNGRGH